jgi:penicillin-binding protein 1A
MSKLKRTGRVAKNSFVTRSGSVVKIHRSLGEKLKGRGSGKARAKAERMAGMPKGRVKRFFYRLQPKRLYHYWFSREGGIMALKVLGVGFIAGFLLMVGMFAYFRKDLPNLRDITGNNIGGSIRYYDRTGKTLLWEDYDAAKRIPVKQDEMSNDVKDATVAIEDKDFFKHGGFDVRGITRAAVSNATGGSTQGGSTLTQQLVKLTQNWTEERTLTRKLKELILAVELERSYSKDEILNGYLNTAPYGGVEYGVEAAARDYFDKSAKDLTLAESAMLAAIPKSPTLLSPYSPSFDREAFIGRQHYVLDLMQQQGYITAEERDAAKQVDVIASVKPRKPKYDGIKAPYFVLTAKEQLEEQFGAETVKRGGWRVTTTLDLGLQDEAEKQVKAGLAQIKRQGGDTAAFAAEDVSTGQMVALVGGVDFSNPEYGQNNYARIKLPPGSSYKPYDFAALIDSKDNFGAGSVLYDTQGPLEGYPCTNKQRPKQGGNCLWDYDFRYPGPLTLRYALGGSRNVPAMKAMLLTGIDKTIETSEKLGLKSGYNCYTDDNLTKEGPCYASSSIGDGAYLKLDEHVHAQASLSRMGTNIPQTYILKIDDAQDKPVYEWKQEKGEQAVRPDSAYIINDILSDPNASYFPAGRKPQRFGDWKFAMKTGTTNDAKDGWMTGYSTKYSASVWVGYHTRRVEMSGTMESMTQPIWQGWMRTAHTGQPAQNWQKPAGVKSESAYVVRTHVGVGSVEPSPSTDLFPSWYKNTKKQSSAKKTIDKVSNKLATECTPARAKQELTETDASSFSGDTFVDGGGANTSQQDDVHKCSDAKPSISLNVQKEGNNYNLIATVNQGTHPLSSDKFKGSVTFDVGGQQLPGGTFEINSPGTVVYRNYKPDFSGSKTVTATLVDSVLYDATASSSITGEGALGLSAQMSGGNAQFSWTGATGTVTVYRADNGNSLCSSGSSSCSNSSVNAGVQVYARDASGNQSSTVTISN